MKYTITFDQTFALQHGLNMKEAAVYDYLLRIPSWSDCTQINSFSYYFASRTKVIKDMPIISNKPDTVYRLYKNLEAKNLIYTTKIEGKDFVHILPVFAKTYARKKIRDSEKNPSGFGKFSENKGSDSENFPTYNSISIDNSIRDKYVHTNNPSFQPENTGTPSLKKDTTSSPRTPSSPKTADDQTMIDSVIRDLDKKIKKKEMLELLNGIDVTLPQARIDFANYFVLQQKRKYNLPKHLNGMLTSFRKWVEYAGQEVELKAKVDSHKEIREYVKRIFLGNMIDDNQWLGKKLHEAFNEMSLDQLKVGADYVKKSGMSRHWDNIIKKARDLK
jgi:hypothetical protein